MSISKPPESAIERALRRVIEAEANVAHLRQVVSVFRPGSRSHQLAQRALHEAEGTLRLRYTFLAMLRVRLR
jgi:hypothetical protein